MPRELTERERTFLTTPHERSLWGQLHTITPALVDEVFGDGKRIVGLTPTMHRPNYYVAQVDSSWPLENNPCDDTFADHLDEIFDAIEEQYGRSWEHGDDCEDDCNADACHVGFPGLNSEGCSWFEIEMPGASEGKG